VRHTADVTIVLAHGAGSTGEAARRLLGLDHRMDIVTVEDRTGDVDRVLGSIDAAVTAHPGCVEIIGVSLGAHAAARWAMGRAEGPALTFILPAWTGPAGRTAQATADAAQGIGEVGIASALEGLMEAASHEDIVELLGLAWGRYTDEQLRACLATAARGRGPTSLELSDLRLPARIIGWYGDAFHPASTAVEWSRRVPGARVSLAARPSIPLLQAAMRSVSWPG
jgi:hypothetical protein